MVVIMNYDDDDDDDDDDEDKNDLIYLLKYQRTTILNLRNALIM